MILKGIDLGHVLSASGARGFSGEGYWFHEPWKPFGLDYAGSTFVAKTTTRHPRPGNMPLDGRHRPRELFPRCIVVKPLAGVVLNAVGLSGPGAGRVIGSWVHEARPPDPFVASFMCVDPLPEAWPAEARSFFDMLAAAEDRLPKMALELNLSCPNTGIDPSHLAEESDAILGAAMASGLRAPVLVKLNALVAPIAAARIAAHAACAALVVSNTIPWGQLPDRIDWQRLFGSEVSPLAHLGGGGLSGAPLLPIVRDWICSARRTAGVTKPIVGGGGVLSAKNADQLIDAGAAAIELGSVSILRPWRVREIIRHVNQRLENEERMKTNGSDGSH